MTLKIEILDVQPVSFIMHILDYRRRSEDQDLPAAIRQSFADIADILEEGAVMTLYDLEYFQALLMQDKKRRAGGFARSRAVQIMFEYLDLIESLNPQLQRPFTKLSLATAA